MKSILTFFTIFSFLISFSQINPKNIKDNDAAYFLDNNFVHKNVLTYFNANEIESVNVKKGSITIQGQVYNGQIIITSKTPNKYKFLTLHEIKIGFTNSKKDKTIFMINGEFITDKIETYKIDKEYILKVKLLNSNDFESLKNLNSDIDILNILTKTQENITKSDKIILRGNANTELN